MATKEANLGTRTVERPANYRTGFEERHSTLSSWLTGLMFLIVVALVMSIIQTASQLPRTGESMNGPMVLPEGSTVPGSRIQGGDEQALDSIAGVPASGSGEPISIDSKITKPDTDPLPGRDSRKPLPVPAPL